MWKIKSVCSVTEFNINKLRWMFWCHNAWHPRMVDIWFPFSSYQQLGCTLTAQAMFILFIVYVFRIACCLAIAGNIHSVNDPLIPTTMGAMMTVQLPWIINTNQSIFSAPSPPPPSQITHKPLHISMKSETLVVVLYSACSAEIVFGADLIRFGLLQLLRSTALGNETRSLFLLLYCMSLMGN